MPMRPQTIGMLPYLNKRPMAWQAYSRGIEGPLKKLWEDYYSKGLVPPGRKQKADDIEHWMTYGK